MVTLIFLLYSLTFSAYADQGLGIDPNGGRIAAASGGTFDPNGRPVSAYSDEGPGLCPVGRRANTTADSGGGMDPNG